jgi:hypothetical protein
MKVLVLTSEPISAGQLHDALGGDADPRDAEVMIVAPALQEGRVKFWLSDSDEAIAKAQEVRRETVEQLGEAGSPPAATRVRAIRWTRSQMRCKRSRQIGSSSSPIPIPSSATARTSTPARSGSDSGCRSTRRRSRARPPNGTIS